MTAVYFISLINYTVKLFEESERKKGKNAKYHPKKFALKL